MDDDETLREVLAELFSSEHLCHTVGTAEGALELLRERDYNAVITDISMPGMSGESLLGFIKIHSPGTPVIFITGTKDREFAQLLRVKGAAGYLLKPFDLAEISETVARVVKSSHRV